MEICQKERMNYLLRNMPENLHQKIKELAKKEKRSWNSQALILLEMSLKERIILDQKIELNINQ